MAEKKKIHFLLLLGASYVVYVLTSAVITALSWTDHYHGIITGLFAAVFPGSFAWGIIFLPLTLLAGLICRHPKAARFRTFAIVFAPSLLIVGFAAFNPPTARNFFNGETGTPVPPLATGFLSYQSGEGFGAEAFGGRHDYYYFKCAPQDVQNLISTLKLAEVDAKAPPTTINAPAPGLPNPNLWPGKRVFQLSQTEPDMLFITLITDDKQDQVYLDYMD
jgi:hypothetical protein